VTVTVLPPTPTVSLAAIPSRTSGVAPLAVFFDATGTTHSSTFRPFHDLEYRWDFGDPAGGSWTSTPNMPNLSRNSATGPVAAHVYETSGTYTVKLTVTDGTNTATTEVQITVANPDTEFASNTICIAAVIPPIPGSDGCPSGALPLVQPSFDLAIAANIPLGMRRLLFKRGDTFTSTSGANIAVTGPGIIGAFGSGAKPKIQSTGNDAILALSSATTPTIKDWRVMDLELDGLSGTSTFGIIALGGIDQVTILRLNIHHVWFGLEFSEFRLDIWNNSGQPGHTLWDQLAVVDSNINTIVNSGYGAFISASRFSFLGNVGSDAIGGTHVLRVAHASKAVISHNALSNPHTTNHSLKFHATQWQGGGVSDPGGTGHYSENVVISDNKLMGGTSAIIFAVSIGPDNPQDDQRLRDFIIERNWFSAAGFPGQLLALILYGVQDFTVRNNLFDLTGAGNHAGIRVERRGVEPLPTRIGIVNNTFFSNDSGNDFTAVRLDSTATNTTVKNNLVYAPSHTSPIVLSNSGDNTTASNNSTNAQAKSILPNFVSGSPSIPQDFKLQADSYAINAGAPVPVFSDLFRVRRPQDGTIDIGAAEGP